jgi:hypothetical protein
MRLTDSTWQKLGQIARERDVTRADLIELWAKSDFSRGSTQLALFDTQKEVITKDTRKTQTQLANRFGVSSADLTNWHKYGDFAERSLARDPDRIAWIRDETTKLYSPSGWG